MWTEIVVVQFSVQSEHLPGVTEENKEKLRMSVLRAELVTRNLL